MEKQIKGIKLNMSQIFNEDGTVIPVTLIRVEENIDGELLNKDVYIVGKSKGAGFAGGMKRWGFHGEHATRGQSNKQRAPGAIGSQTPGRVRLGKKMAGRLGNKQVTIKGLKIVRIMPDVKEMMISGPLPGARNSKILVKVL